MKNLLIIIIAILAHTATGQSLPELIKEYEEDCNEIVQDTIKQQGTIEYSMVPVYDAGGKTIYYALGDPDTTWSKPNCPEHKYNLYADCVTYVNTDLTWTTGHYDYVNTGHIKNTVKAEGQKITVTRDYECECKKRRIIPFGEDFWKYVKSRK